MKHLRTLVLLVAEKSQHPLPLLGKLEQKPNKETTLYENIKSGTYQTDEQAAQDLYGKAPNCQSYVMLKSRLRQKMLNHLFFLNLDKSQYRISEVYELECRQLLYQARVLALQHEHFMAKKLLIRTFKLAKEAEFTSIVVNCLELMIFVFSADHKFANFKKAEKLIKHYQTKSILEQEAYIIYYKARMIMAGSTTAGINTYLPNLVVVISKLKQFWKQTKSHTIFEHYYRLYIVHLEYSGSFERIIDLTSKNIEPNRQSKHYNPKRSDSWFDKFICVYAYLRTKQYSEGINLCHQCVHTLNRSSCNWFAFMENYYLLAMYSYQYDLSMHVLNEVSQNTFFGKISEAAKERWAMFRVFVELIHPPPSQPKYPTIQSLLAVTPIYSKDKLGFNIILLLLQFLYHLKADEREGLIYLTENLKKYAANQLDNQLNNCSILLVRLLLLVTRHEFDAAKCRRKGQALYEQLQTTPVAPGACCEAEIIPHEHLWEFVLNTLAAKTKDITLQAAG